jgi:TonB family protein
VQHHCTFYWPLAVFQGILTGEHRSGAESFLKLESAALDRTHFLKPDLMSDLNTIQPKPPRPPVPHSSRSASPLANDGEKHRQNHRENDRRNDRRQRELMVGSLCLLLLALGIVLWHDRDFWFPDSNEAETDQPTAQPVRPARVAPVPESAPVATLAPAAKPVHTPAHSRVKSDAVNQSEAATQPQAANQPDGAPEPDAPGFSATTSRTALPPLEVEVVAGDNHRVIRPGSSSVHVELQPQTEFEATPDHSGPPQDNDSAANVTSNASEQVQMSADTSSIVTRPVKPNYPMLARQMKVQGSVILQALIGKDGTIQDLRVVSGPHILASAAEDAVRQWHFKPHLEGSEAVETQAKITVNFTISTN